METNLSPDCFSEETALEQCNSYIHSQIQGRKNRPYDDTSRPPGPAITISYQTGSGAHMIARQLAKRLQETGSVEDVLWTVFDHHLVGKVLEEHHLPQSLAKYMPEERRSYIQDVMEEISGLRPPSWVMIPQVAETVVHLAESGHVILVGRGANFITARMTNVFHVRLIAPLTSRISRVQKTNHLTNEEAAKFVAQSDLGRGRYEKAHFHVCADDNLSYHLLVNTDLIPIPEAVELITEGARRCFKRGNGKVNYDK